MSGDHSPEPSLDDLFRRAREETQGVDPPADFAARVLAATARRTGAARAVSVVSRASLTSELGKLGGRAVPLAALAAAAAIALAWTASRTVDAGGVDADLDGIEAVP